MDPDKKPNNPSVYPYTEIKYIETSHQDFESKISHPGITLRDNIAIAAMQSLILKLEIDQHQLRFDSELHSIVPVLSYQIADCMLKAREEENKP